MDTSFDEAFETMLAVNATQRAADHGGPVRLDDVRAELATAPA